MGLNKETNLLHIIELCEILDFIYDIETLRRPCVT